jgi:hypothetical protein
MSYFVDFPRTTSLSNCCLWWSARGRSKAKPYGCSDVIIAAWLTVLNSSNGSLDSSFSCGSSSVFWDDWTSGTSSGLSHSK